MWHLLPQYVVTYRHFYEDDRPVDGMGYTYQIFSQTKKRWWLDWHNKQTTGIFPKLVSLPAKIDGLTWWTVTGKTMHFISKSVVQWVKHWVFTSKFWVASKTTWDLGSLSHANMMVKQWPLKQDEEEPTNSGWWILSTRNAGMVWNGCLYGWNLLGNQR